MAAKEEVIARCSLNDIVLCVYFGRLGHNVDIGVCVQESERRERGMSGGDSLGSHVVSICSLQKKLKKAMKKASRAELSEKEQMKVVIEQPKRYNECTRD